jgi:2'-5' RNA ligase
MRLFFAVLPDFGVAAEIGAVVVAHCAQIQGRWVAPENYHLTLAFLGDVDPEYLPSLRRFAAQQRVAGGELCLGAVEHWADAEVLVAAARKISGNLDYLALNLASQRPGSSQETCWRPHVTLARKVLQPPVLQAMSPIYWTPNEFVLVESRIAPSGSVYTVVDRWSLLDKN